MFQQFRIARIFVLFLLLSAACVLPCSAAPGDVDLSFNGGAITSQFFQNSLKAVAVQPDGKVLIGGIFNVIAGVPRNGLARLNADGSVDMSFVPPPFSQSDLVNPIRIAVQPDGKIVVAGSNFRIGSDLYQLIRLNADGSIDPSFTLLAINSGRGIEGLALQTDGKILIGGDFFSVGGVERRVVARLNSDGTLDTSFSIGLPATHSGRAEAIAIQPDGKVIAGGLLSVTVGATTFVNVVRLNSNGVPDTTFSVAGDSLDGVHAIVQQLDGKILIAGDGSGNTGSRVPVARVKADGSLDSSFNAPIGSPRQVYDIALEPTGKIIAVGNFCSLPFAPNACGINRFNTNGSRDDSFFPYAIPPCGTNGFDNTPVAVVRQPDGKILVGGSFFRVSCFERQRIVRLQNKSKTAAEFDGDGRTDISVYRPSEGTWYLNRSTAGFGAIHWGGAAGDVLIPGDYDGDGKADFAIWRPSDDPALADFYILNSNGFTVSGYSHGLTTDIPVVGDYDGDGKADIVVFRPLTGTWYLFETTTQTTRAAQFGSTGDVPMSMDYNGDGKADLAVFRPSSNTWYIAKPTGVPAQNFNSVQFGVAGDILVPADYDGDNKDDVAVFRPSNGTWYILRSTDGGVSYVQFGASGDVPVPGDYDGDGKNDVAVYRAGTWYLNRSTAGFSATAFGLATDTAIPARYHP